MITEDGFDAEPYVSEIEIGGDLHEDGTRSGVLKRNAICNALIKLNNI